MIELFNSLLALEQRAAFIVKAAHAAYAAALAAGADAKALQALDPGRHQIIQGAIQTSIAHAEQVLGPAAVTEARAAFTAAQAGPPSIPTPTAAA